MDFIKRINNLRKMFEVLEVDSMVVFNGFNLRYLIGFQGGTGEGILAVSRQKIQFVTDARYTEEYKDILPEEISLVETRDYFGQIATTLNKWGVKKVGFEENLPFNIFDFLDENIEAPFVPTPSPIEILREIKDSDELDLLREAAKRSVVAFNQLLDQIHAGMNEREVANLLDFLAKKQGLEKASFDTIVASGKNSAKPHATVSDRILTQGDLVTIDFGYYYEGYTSDITRTIAVGDIDQKLKDIYNIVSDANKAALNAIKVDMKLSEVDQAARNIINTSGYQKEFNHSTGHGAGLDIHEGPRVSTNSEDIASIGQFLTIEPGIYIPNLGGVRIEDDVIVSKDGYEILTDGITKELIHI